MGIDGKTAILSFRLHYKIWISAGLLIVYALAIFLDLPAPAGTRYRQNLPDQVLIEWGATPIPQAQQAPHWWYKIQGLRGWSANPEGWAWARAKPAPISHWILLLGLGFLGVVGLNWLERLNERWPRLGPVSALIALILFFYGFQILTLQLKSINSEQLLLDRITDTYFTGYFNSALRFDDLRDYFSGYGATLNDPAYCSHCQTHPPGPVLLSIRSRSAHPTAHPLPSFGPIPRLCSPGWKLDHPLRRGPFDREKTQNTLQSIQSLLEDV